MFTVHVDYSVATWLVGIEISALSKRGWYFAKHSSLWQWVRQPSNSLWVPISQSDSDPTRCSLCYCILENKAKMNNRVIWIYQRAGSWIIAFQLVNCGCPLPVCPCLFVSLAFGPLVLTFLAASLSGSSRCFFFLLLKLRRHFFADQFVDEKSICNRSQLGGERILNPVTLLLRAGGRWTQTTGI